MNDVLETVGIVLLLALVLTVVLSVLFLPTIVASERKSVSFVGILLLNLLGLVTGFFWFVALLWACLGATRPPPAPSPVPPRVVGPSTFAASTVRGANQK